MQNAMQAAVWWEEAVIDMAKCNKDGCQGRNVLITPTERLKKVPANCLPSIFLFCIIQKMFL